LDGDIRPADATSFHRSSGPWPARSAKDPSMGMPSHIAIVDTMIGFPHEGFGQFDFIRKQTKDLSSREEMQFPAEYMS
jgi:hypothetical protein